jgi:hypothetical protein
MFFEILVLLLVGGIGFILGKRQSSELSKPLPNKKNYKTVRKVETNDKLVKGKH